MTSIYNVELVDGILKISFGEQPAGNNAIVPEAVAVSISFGD